MRANLIKLIEGFGDGPKLVKPQSPEWWEEELEKISCDCSVCCDPNEMKILISKVAKAEYERGYRACQDKGEIDSWHRNSKDRKRDIEDARKLALSEAIEVLEDYACRLCNAMSIKDLESTTFRHPMQRERKNLMLSVIQLLKNLLKPEQ